jgi:2-polyprenyl-6-methoxyphenol hydroxylase-like FAD-dependent oxidoreductase
VQVLLVGDAAHTMTPILGQGLNAGLEDVNIFAAVLKDTLASGGDVEAALRLYTKLRLPDVKALLLINQLMAQERTLILVRIQLPNVDTLGGYNRPLGGYKW